MLLFGLTSLSQTVVKGPQCTMAGVEYTYFLYPDVDSGSNMEICISGGVFAESGASCQTIKATSSIKLLWDGQASKGAITIKTNSGNTTFSVSITNPLNGGAIDTAIKSQIIISSSVAKQINCSPATGGSCNPIFDYQWQQSANGMNWNLIPEATGQNLKLSGAQKASQYYRRQTTERNSGTMTYSNVAAIFLETK